MLKRNIVFTTLVAAVFFLLGQFSIQQSDDLEHLRESVINLSKYSFLLGCQLGSKLSTDTKSHDEACSILMAAYNLELGELVRDF